jgi:hypothetical protein
MLGIEKRLAVMYGTGEESGEVGQGPAAEKKGEGSGELGKIGLAVAFLAILLIIGLYLSHDMRLATMQADMNEKLASVLTMEAKVGALDKRLASIETLPEMARKMYVNTAIADIKQRAAALTTMAGEEQKAALAKVEEILAGLQKDISK